MNLQPIQPILHLGPYGKVIPREPSRLPFPSIPPSRQERSILAKINRPVDRPIPHRRRHRPRRGQHAPFGKRLKPPFHPPPLKNARILRENHNLPRRRLQPSSPRPRNTQSRPLDDNLNFPRPPAPAQRRQRPRHRPLAVARRDHHRQNRPRKFTQLCPDSRPAQSSTQPSRQPPPQ